jgi:hypothetical protein
MEEILNDQKYHDIIRRYTNDEPAIRRAKIQRLNKAIEHILYLRRTTKATALAAEKADQTERRWQEQVPIEYHGYGIVFSDEEAQRFPKPRPWDHAIDLLPDAPATLDCKTYPLAEGQ